MKFYHYIAFLFAFLLMACSDEEKEEFLSGNGTKIVWSNQINVPEGILQTKGYGGVLTKDKRPVDYYPLDKMFLAIPQNGGSFGFLPIAVTPKQTGATDKNFFLTIELQPNGKLKMTGLDNQTMENIEPGTGFFFLSQPAIRFSMNKKTGIPTGSGKPTYAPCGDNLFRSLYYAFLVEDGKLVAKVKNVNQYDVIDINHHQVTMNRGTSVWTSQMVIANYDDITSDGAQVVCDALENYGALSDWTTRCYLSHYPVLYDFRDNISNTSPTGKPVVNTDDGAIFDIVAYTGTEKGEKKLPFRSTYEQHYYDGSDQDELYFGYGHKDLTYSFIYNVGDGSGVELCFEITSPKGQRRTLIMPANGPLSPNMNLKYGVIVDYRDFIEAFDINYTKSADTKGVEDEILDIPYKVVVEELPIMEKIEK